MEQHFAVKLDRSKITNMSKILTLTFSTFYCIFYTLEFSIPKMKSKGNPAMTVIRTKNTNLPIVPDTSSQYLAEMMNNVKPSNIKSKPETKSATTPPKPAPTVLTGTRRSNTTTTSNILLNHNQEEAGTASSSSPTFELKTPSGATLSKSNESEPAKSSLIQEISSNTTSSSLPPVVTPVETTRPTYKLTYQSLHNDYSKYTTGRTRTDTNIDALCIRVLLPGVGSVQDIDLDTTTRSVSLNVPRLYDLCIDLPVSVDHDNGNAKFDKKKSELVIVLPILATAQMEEDKVGSSMINVVWYTIIFIIIKANQLSYTFLLLL